MHNMESNAKRGADPLTLLCWLHCVVRTVADHRRALGMRPGWRRTPVKPEPVEELRRQADIAVRVLTVFRGAALLLDEVGLVATALFPRGRDEKPCRTGSCQKIPSNCGRPCNFVEKAKVAFRQVNLCLVERSVRTSCLAKFSELPHTWYLVVFS